MGSRIQRLNKIKSSMPVYNPTAAAKDASGRAMSLQQVVKDSPKGAGPVQAQEIGQTMAAQGGLEAANRAKVAASEKEQIGNIMLAEREQALQQQMLNDRTNFKTDQNGRIIMNQEQMLDYVQTQLL